MTEKEIDIQLANFANELANFNQLLQQIAEDLHAMRKAQAAELKLVLAMLPPQPAVKEKADG